MSKNDSRRNKNIKYKIFGHFLQISIIHDVVPIIHYNIKIKMDNIYDLEELFKIDDPDEDTVNNIPENVVEAIMKKQETIH